MTSRIHKHFLYEKDQNGNEYVLENEEVLKGTNYVPFCGMLNLEAIFFKSRRTHLSKSYPPKAV